MNKKLKFAKLGLFASLIAVLIATINVQISGGSVAILGCMIAVFLSNVAIYASQKKKDDDSSK